MQTFLIGEEPGRMTASDTIERRDGIRRTADSPLLVWASHCTIEALSFFSSLSLYHMKEFPFLTWWPQDKTSAS